MNQSKRTRKGLRRLLMAATAIGILGGATGCTPQQMQQFQAAIPAIQQVLTLVQGMLQQRNAGATTPPTTPPFAPQSPGVGTGPFGTAASQTCQDASCASDALGRVNVQLRPDGAQTSGDPLSVQQAEQALQQARQRLAEARAELARVSTGAAVASVTGPKQEAVRQAEAAVAAAEERLRQARAASAQPA